jgi:serine protease Do
MSAPGERVKLKVWRDHQERTIEAKLGGASDKVQTLADASATGQGGLGLALRPLTRDEKREAKVEFGLVVEDVDGAAARAGIQAGDVLLAINGRSVDSIDQIQSVLAHKPKSVALLVQRNGDKIFVPVKVG